MGTNGMLRKAIAKFVETELDGEIVIMNIDTGSFHALKGTGLAVWKLIDDQPDLTAIKTSMLADFDIDEPTCSAEIDAFVRSMVKAGLVEEV
jgi:Coenzyme PQQ synthesis protein D (PqqD)